MAVIIDEAWLKDKGIEATGLTAETLIDEVIDELEVRVGMAIADKLTDAQIAEFEAIDGEDERVEWLERALPDYPSIVDEKEAEIGQELSNSKDKVKKIRAWSQA